MHHKQTFYDRLCVSQTASTEEIRSAYRKRALKLHPDRNHDPQATQLFQALGEAYDTLKDPELRCIYDITLEENSHTTCCGCFTFKN